MTIWTYFVGEATLNDNIALVQLHPNGAVDCALAARDCRSNEFTFGTEEVSIVKDTAQSRSDELIAELTDSTVQGQALNIQVGSPEDSSTRRLVATSGLYTNITVFNNVDTADTVLPSDGVESIKDINGIGVNLVTNGDLGRKTGLEFDTKSLGASRSVFGRCGQLPHIHRRCGVGILKNTSLIRDVVQVLICGGVKLNFENSPIFNYLSTKA